MTSIRTLLIATANAGKVAELRSMMADLPVLLAGLDEFQSIGEVPETGSTFDENARLKAAGYARQTGLYTLADDSGLKVAALGGGPGVLSARYGGEGLSFDRKIEKLLADIAASGTDDRS